MAAPEFPWLYPFVQDPSGSHYPDGVGEVWRPMVRMSLEGMDESVLALVDSGAERTLVAPWIGRLLGLYPSDEAPKIMLGMDGETLPTAFYQATVRLHAPEPREAESVSWETHIGVPTSWRAPVWNAILGQIGMFDHFTITMQRHARMLAIEPFGTFDERFSTE